MASKPKLEYGSRGEAVVEAQAKVNLALPDAQPPLALDGIYGTQTVKRVKQFQMSRGLAGDGIVGPKTWAALDNAPAKPGVPSAPPPSTQKAPRVGFGAKLICSCGSKLSVLRYVPTDRAAANVNDCWGFSNVGPFGKCHSTYHPALLMKFYMNKEFTPEPCTPVVQGPWSPALPIEKVGNPPAPAIDKGSVLICSYGGVITIL